MPFDLSSAKPVDAPAAGGFDLASAKPVSSMPPASSEWDDNSPLPNKPKPPRGIMDTAVDLINAPQHIARGVVRGVIAPPIANIAGLGALGVEAGLNGRKGNGAGPIDFRNRVESAITTQPPNAVVDSVMEFPRVIGRAVGETLTAVKDAAKGDSANDHPRGMAVNATAEAINQALGMAGVKGARAAPGAMSVIDGSAAKGARSAAQTATRDALGTVDAGYAGRAADVTAQAGRDQAALQREALRRQYDAMTEANAYADAATRTQRDLDAIRQRTGVPTAETIGGQVRDAYGQAMNAAKEARAKASDPLYVKAKEAAAARERDGARIDVKPALKEIDEMLANGGDNIPELRAQLMKLKQAVEGVQASPKAGTVGSGKVTSTMRTPAASRDALTYKELDTSLRYIKDIAFSGEAEGYGALIRNTAKKLSLALDGQISKFVPEHAEAARVYRKMSEPMETLTTRYGQAIRDTEGGLRDEAYAKVPGQDLPRRVFSRKEGIEQLVDALAGGKDASPGARAAAQAKVDTWVENWILDSARGKVGDAARVSAPGQRAALTAAPGAAARLDATFGTEQAKVARAPELEDAAKRARAAGEKAATERAAGEQSIAGKAETQRRAIESQRLKARQRIEQADLDLSHGSPDKAYRGYVEALRANMAMADPAKYRAAIQLIERASTIEEKTKRARKLAMGVAGLVGVGAAARVGVQIPGLGQ